MSNAPTYAVITPARNESDNIRRLGRCLIAQTVLPRAWVIVDDGSTDGTREAALDLGRSQPWIRLISSPGALDREGALREGRSQGRDVVAFNAGLEAPDSRPEFVVKLDADISMGPDYFERLLGRFRDDPILGIASGICYEQEGDRWVPRYSTEGHVRGASRVWRSQCLDAVLPLETRLGWDGIDELQANVKGWRTTSFLDLPVRHHRAVGVRDGTRRAWAAQGDTAHFMGYRPSYLALRTLHHARRDPAALAMIGGYLAATVRRKPRYSDEAVRAHLASRQRLRTILRRRRESLGEPADEP